tara:strand:- start:1412 stop:1747 length:336 start_codon:yes stop_codon:yes gene_type:complete
MDLQKEIEQLNLSFSNIPASEHDRKADNVKSRIYLMKQLIASHPQPGGRGSEPKSKPQIKTKDTRSEMDDLRSKLVPKTKTKSLPFDEKDMESKDADAELKRALDKAFESI